MLKELTLDSEIWEGIMKLVTEVNHYIASEKQKTNKQKKQLNITDFFKNVD